MPVAPTYPGVYIEEIPSGVRTITGVATSITAFIGRAVRGPVNEPITVNNFGDFERTFGGLSIYSTMSYTIRDFFLNGGSQAVIVRLFSPYLATSADRDQQAAQRDTLRTKAQDTAKAVFAAAKAKATGDPLTNPMVTDINGAANAEAAKYPDDNDPAKKCAHETADKAVQVVAANAKAGMKGADFTKAVDSAVDTIAADVVNALAPLTRARLMVNGISDTDRLAIIAYDAASTVAAAAKAKTGHDLTFTDTTAKATNDAAAAAQSAMATKYPNEPEKTPVATAVQAVIAAVTANAISGKTVADFNNAVDGSLPAAPDIEAAVSNAAKAANALALEAASEGAWANTLRARIEYLTDKTVAQGVIDRYGLTKFGVTADDLFDLLVRDMSTGTTEQFRNVTFKDGPRNIVKVLANDSNLVRVVGDQLPAQRPSMHPFDKDIWADTNRIPTYSGVADNDMASDSAQLSVTDYNASEERKQGIYSLKKTDIFNLLCIPEDERGADVSPDIYQPAMKFCADRRAMLIVDSPAAWGQNTENAASTARDNLTTLGLSGPEARNAAIYFPRVEQADPLSEGQLDTFVPCGIVAGIMARTDVQRGVWKAPAGLDATLSGIRGLEVGLTDQENGMLNPLGINCLRSFPIVGQVVWGARTLRGADLLADEYKYVPVRRLALYIEESLYRGTQWVVFEPNDKPLWAQIRLNVGAFMHNLFRQGAFQGSTPNDAYFVKCDDETTPQNDIDLGIVNVVVGFAPLKPAEFVIIKIQQMAGQVVV